MKTKINWYKIALFTTLTYCLSWFVSFLLSINNLDLSQTKTAIFVAVFYMSMPAISAVIVQKLIYKQSLKLFGWTFPKKNIKYYLLLPIILVSIILLTTLIIYILGNQNVIPNFGKLNFSSENIVQFLQETLTKKGKNIDLSKTPISKIPPILFFILLLVQGIVVGGIFNVPATFGEEFGWRGILFHETKKMGFWKSSILIGIIWGIWHFPLIFIGLNYPENHKIGLLLMTLFTISLSPIFSYIRLKTNSILGPSMLHGMINGSAGIFAIFVANQNELYSSISGLAGIFGGTIISVSIYLLDKKNIQKFYSEK